MAEDRHRNKHNDHELTQENDHERIPEQGHIHHHHQSPSDPEQVKAQLAELLADIPYSVPLYLFSKKGTNDQFTLAARQVLQLITEIAPKVSLVEYDLDHKKARQWGVGRSPEILFDPENYSIRWLGAPLGEEGAILVQALIMLGRKSGGTTETSLKVLEKINSPREVKIFVSLSCPYCPQQAVNILKAAVEKPKLVSMEIIDIQANADLAEKYQAFSTPQTFVGDKLIARGAQPEELFMASLEKMEEQSFFIPEVEAEEIKVDLVIIGGGPAGLSAGIYAARSGLKAVILEKNILGGKIATTPEIENYPGISRIGGKTLVEILVTHALEYSQIFPQEEAVEIIPGELLQVITNRRRFITRAVLIATGAQNRRLGVPGETSLSGKGVSYCSTCDGPIFKGQKVIVAGGGNSAATEALHLNHIGVDVTIVHRRDSLRAQQHLIKKLTQEKIPVLWNTEIKRINGTKQVEGVELLDNQTGKTRQLAAQGVFISIGYLPESGLAKAAGAALDETGYIRQDEFHRTNVPGIYCAGDVGGGFKQIVTAAAQGAEAAMAVFEDLVNPYWKSADKSQTVK